MEQHLPFYDNAGSDSFFRFSQIDKQLGDAERLHILETLLGCLDLADFAQTLQNLLTVRLGLCGLEIQSPAGRLALGSSGTLTRLMDCPRDTATAIRYHFNRPLNALDNRRLDEIHTLVTPQLRNVIRHSEIKRLASKDHLTSLGNRAGFEEHLSRLFSHAKRSGEVFGLMVLDMDKFKAINDSFGHQEGDNVLIAMAQAISTSLRDTDFAFRFGGDEFCCLIPDADSATLQRVSHRIRQAMHNQPLLAKHHMRCSIGTGLYQSGEERGALFSRADAALYQDKQNASLLGKTA
ncbi:diguanylate cyclase [Bowmanella denitrificans]|uniref:diguanylate cyclase n=1 Tax=Bowmanella denitrificans TaxID=366582 RepID=A0ABP3HA39_9ALTE